MAYSDNFHYDRDGRVIVYIDGCCWNNGIPGKPKRGGIGVYFGRNNDWNFFGPVDGRPTNNIAEIQAATKAVSLCRDAELYEVHIKTDSQQVSNAMNIWMESWKKRNVKGVVNAYEYKKLLMASRGMDVKYSYVQGHASSRGYGNNYDKIGNDAADALANEGASNAPVYY